MNFSKKISFLILLFCSSLFSQHHIIPEPQTIEYKDVKFELTKKININTMSDSLAFEIIYLKQLLEKKGYEVALNEKQTIKSIELNINLNDISNQNPEEYSIKCNDNTIELVASQNEGIFRGIQTLDQLFPWFTENQKMTNCIINDYPKMGWRGLMLDVSRHFFTVAEVKSYIDLMSRYKFNVFHWHLTDDEGWRIEIKSLPKLTEIGAWRAERTGKFRTREAPTASEPKTYGGFYTQDQIKEVVAYAKERHITIVPEIDVPGHSMALLAAYPELSTKKEPKMVSCGFKFSEWYGEGKFKMLVENTLNPSDENVYDFLDKIYGEVALLFPSEYIHVGGDEAYHGYWEADKNCQKLMECNNLKNSLELQSYFMKRVEKIITSKGKKMIGWDEILYGGLADGAAVMSWQGMKGGIEAAKAGHKVVMSPTQYCYLDYTQGDKSIEETVYADLSLKKTYEFNPVPDGVDEKLILGGQGNLWTEQVPNLSHAFYMTYPRALAISESLWSPRESKNWDAFSKKIDYHFSIFDKEEIDICKAVYDPIIKVYKEGEKIMCALSCETNSTTIYYTLDSTFPNKKSTIYTVPFEIPNTKIILRATTFRDGKQLGRLLHLPKSELDKRVK
ncbi:family 20 glycosylhydrolase [Flavobacterium sp.]|uniref:beta-N-acetylhexosaminidase n=1 Tax=Flavobacterium sp. TaxID=239 RepID=UPI00286DDB86|nr:family 20 glycosylhydrolase [Flavobacterium sp.]